MEYNNLFVLNIIHNPEVILGIGEDIRKLCAYIMSFYRKDLRIHDFGIYGMRGSWNQFLMDTEKWLYFLIQAKKRM